MIEEPFKHIQEVFGVFPIRDPEGKIVIKTLESLSDSLKAEIEFAVGQFVEQEIVLKDELTRLIESNRKENVNFSSKTKGLQFKIHEKSNDIGLKKLRAEVEETPIVMLVNEIITKGIDAGASDIHLEPYEDKFRLRYRIDGKLKEDRDLPFEKKAAIISRLKVMSELDIAERRLPQDGRIRVEGEDKVIDLRISVIPTDFGEKASIRILDKSQLRLDLEKLGMTERQLPEFIKALNKKRGIILVTGPTGSGKTTTLYAALNYLKSPDINIMTIEDPIEYNLSGINQSQVKPSIGYTFATALRTYLRQDPDVIMVGEIRDRETAEIAVRASLTGHLVLSTLHTNDAASAVTRLADIGIEPYLISSSITLVIAQRLVGVLCDNCKVLTDKKDDITRSYGIDIPRNTKFYTSRGCNKCDELGYSGRTGIFEIMSIDDDIREVISSKIDYSFIKKAAQKKGMLTLLDIGLDHAANGITTLEDIIRETA